MPVPKSLLTKFYDHLEKIYLAVREEKNPQAYRFIRPFFWIASLGYQAGLYFYKKKEKWFETSHQVPSFVVCIGNIAVGGSGKTPFVAKLAHDLSVYSPTIIARGYRSKQSKAISLQVAPHHQASDVGDEPLWFAKNCPHCNVFIGKSKSMVAKSLDRKKHPLLLIDDGLQHRKLKNDFSIVMLHTKMNWEKGYLPYGCLRDHPQAISSADLIVLHQIDSLSEFAKEITKVRKYSQAPVIGTQLRLDPSAVDTIQGKNIAIVTAIAFPRPFIQDLQKHCTVMATLRFPDHGEISSEKLAHWWNSLPQVQNIDYIVCTEKDFIKWPSENPLPVPVIPMRGEMEVIGNPHLYHQALQQIEQGFQSKWNLPN